MNMEIFLLFILGMLIGSFLNVVIFRIEKGESFVAGRSHCQTCHHSLAWYENIPLISFVFLRGKCRHCQALLSWQYPLVEFATALFFAASYGILTFYAGSISQLFIGLLLLIIISFALLIGVYDFRFSLIPDVFLWGLNISTFLFLIFHWYFSLQPVFLFPPEISSSLLGALVTGGFFFFLVFISKETWMGWGDVWLGIWGGMLLGIELTQLFITVSFTFGAVIGITFLYTKKKTLKTEVPFGPYILLAGSILFVLFYYEPRILQFLSPWLPGIIQ